MTIIMQSQNFHLFQQELGSRIQTARKQQGYSQERLAELLDMHRVSIGYIEQGRQSPKLSTLFQIAEILDIPIKDLIPS